MRDIVKNCNICKKGKRLTKKLPLGHLRIPEKIFDMISIDLYGSGSLSVQSGKNGSGMIELMGTVLWPRG